MASSEALSMPHRGMHDALSEAAAKFIKTDKNNHQNHVLNWYLLVYYSYVGRLRNGTDILEEDGWLPEWDACRFPSLLTSSGLHHWGIIYVPDGTLICNGQTINSRHVDFYTGTRVTTTTRRCKMHPLCWSF
jgi:hypothetical protein